MAGEPEAGTQPAGAPGARTRVPAIEGWFTLDEPAGEGQGPLASEEPGVGAPGGPDEPAGEGQGPLASEEPGVGAPGGPDEHAPALIGSRCTACGTYTFPPAPGQRRCPNPACQGAEQEPVLLSRRGTVWSYTDARYQPPPPYVAAEPYEPFTLAAVELAEERMVVLGQVVPGVTVDDLAVGDQVELVLGTLYRDDDHEYLVWQWRPVPGGSPVAPGGAAAAGDAGVTPPAAPGPGAGDGI